VTPMTTVTVVIHRERHRRTLGWWAESAQVPGWHASADTLTELRALVADGVRFALETDDVEISEVYSVVVGFTGALIQDNGQDASAAQLTDTIKRLRIAVRELAVDVGGNVTRVDRTGGVRIEIPLHMGAPWSPETTAQGQAIMRTALHAAGVGTPNWEDTLLGGVDTSAIVEALVAEGLTPQRTGVSFDLHSVDQTDLAVV